jgi:hypothetical protein
VDFKLFGPCKKSIRIRLWHLARKVATRQFLTATSTWIVWKFLPPKGLGVQRTPVQTPLSIELRELLGQRFHPILVRDRDSTIVLHGGQPWMQIRRCCLSSQSLRATSAVSSRITRIM